MEWSYSEDRKHIVLAEPPKRTKKITDNGDIECNRKNESFLTNLDLSNNEIYVKNEDS